ncbi:leucyl aminopeptidase family protein [Actinoplanes sp. CA-142083]|uniref:leucyl aminopeptidase family protein n=1 Tax=Actinoplanes sp. CA-142083 TaxID=3239903 RepID=UPI003D90D092
MFPIRLTDHLDDDRTWIVPVAASGPLSHEADELSAETAALAEGFGAAGEVRLLPRPLRRPRNVVLAGIGAGDEAGWRAAGAAAVRELKPDERAQVKLAGEVPPEAVRGLAEGLWLGGYRYRDGREDRRSAEVELISPAFSAYAGSLALATASARAAWLARDLTNTPSSLKNPAWLAEELVGAAAGRTGVEVHIRAGAELDRFGGLRAVGGGSVSPPCLVEMSWSPAGAGTHVALVGKGITFDSGGISIKTREGMKRMKVDMGGAAAVAAATLGAAELELPVRVTALLPLAENAVGAAAYRPGDVITHYDGTTSESTNSDAEGRLVLADALGYAVAELDPDVIVDVATLTGANLIALGHRTAALYSHNDDLAAALSKAAHRSGEQVWRLPLPDDYREYLRSDLADRHSSPVRGAGSVVAALYLSEFLGAKAGVWAHLDIAGPAWAETTELEITRGATGWGARTLLRYLESLSA